MLNPPLVTDCYYHVYNGGVEKRKTFMDKRDYKRFLETLDFYRKSPQPMKLSDFRRSAMQLKKVDKQSEIIRIFCYCLMPNHFHLLVQQLEEGGISEFMRKISDSYTRYFNTKHERIGSLFQDKFKAKLIETDEYLLQLSKYIHRNAFPLPMWEGKVYPYSSYGYYLNSENHPFCDIEFISGYFSRTNPKNSYNATRYKKRRDVIASDYKSFVEENEYDDPVGIYNLSIDPDECSD